MSTCLISPSVSTVYNWRRKVIPQLPAGMTVDVNCGNDLCIHPEHVILREKVVHDKWTGLSERVAALGMDESFDLYEMPNDMASIRNARAALVMTKACRLVKFILRSLGGRRGVRFIRIGTWATLGSEGENTTKQYRLLCSKIKDWQRPTIIWLGQWFNPKRRTIHTECSYRGCVFPVHEDGRCRQHVNWFEYPITMHDTALDRGDLWSATNPHLNTPLAAECLVRTKSLERSLRFELKTPKRGETLTYLSAGHKNLGDASSNLQASPSMRHMGHGNGHSKKGGLRSQKSKRKARLKCKVGGNHPEQKKEKRWSRAGLEQWANEILGEEPVEINYIPADERESDEIYETVDREARISWIEETTDFSEIFG